MPRLQIAHRTTYRYRKPVTFGEHRLMMRPRESYDQHVLFSQLKVSPDASVRHVHDVFGNCVSIARFDGASDELTFDSRVVLDHNPAPMPADCEAVVDGAPFAYDAVDLPDLARFMEPGFADPDRAVERWVGRFMRARGSTNALTLLTEMTRAIHTEFKYSRRLEKGTQSAAQTLALGAGTCRDFAVLMMEAARSLGLAAQFVSGYIYVPPADNDERGARLGGAHTHAWVSVYLPSCGWAEFDPTNGLIGNRDLVRVAVVRDPRQATPLWGSWSGEKADYLGMDVDVELSLEPELSASVA